MIAEARSAAASYSTSPTSVPSWVRLIPTSITIAPSLIHSPRTYPGRQIGSEPALGASSIVGQAALRRGVLNTAALPGSNQDYGTAIDLKCCVCGEQRKSFGVRLCDEDAIKGIAVNGGQ